MKTLSHGKSWTIMLTSHVAIVTDVFGVNFTYMWPTADKNTSWIQLDILNYDMQNSTKPSDVCPAQLTRRSCALRPALISYPVTMRFTDAPTREKGQKTSSTDVMLGTLDHTTGTYAGLDIYQQGDNQVPGFKFIKYIDLHGQRPGPAIAGKTTRLGGIARTLQANYGSRAQLTMASNSTLWSTSVSNQFASLQQYNADVNTTEDCPLSFWDPMSAIMTGINDLMFIVSDDLQNRAGANDTDEYYDSSAENIAASQYLDEIHYESHFVYLWGALASTFVCILCILPSYWGFWELGRPVSLGPFEIAHAFQAPALSDVHSGAGHVKEVLKAAGRQKVRYAEGYDERTGKTYKFTGVAEAP